MAANELLRHGKDLESRGEAEKAEEMYRLAIAADPDHAGSAMPGKRLHCVHAAESRQFMRSSDSDPPYLAFARGLQSGLRAEDWILCIRCADLCPGSDTLSQLGLLLQNVKKDNNGAEGMYKRALAANPTHMETLQNYAIFLEEIRGDMAGAEKLYGIALTAHGGGLAGGDSTTPRSRRNSLSAASATSPGQALRIERRTPSPGVRAMERPDSARSITRRPSGGASSGGTTPGARARARAGPAPRDEHLNAVEMERQRLKVPSHPARPPRPPSRGGAPVPGGAPRAR
jgi:hypothetical protein